MNDQGESVACQQSALTMRICPLMVYHGTSDDVGALVYCLVWVVRRIVIYYIVCKYSGYKARHRDEVI